MREIDEIADELTDLVDAKLTKKGIELDMHETDEIRECLQTILEEREGL